MYIFVRMKSIYYHNHTQLYAKPSTQSFCSLPFQDARPSLVIRDVMRSVRQGRPRFCVFMCPLRGCYIRCNHVGHMSSCINYAPQDMTSPSMQQISAHPSAQGPGLLKKCPFQTWLLIGWRQTGSQSEASIKFLANYYHFYQRHVTHAPGVTPFSIIEWCWEWWVMLQKIYDYIYGKWNMQYSH